MPRGRWQFFIDVGGTFTDVVARRPDGTIITHKLLSSGAHRGVIETGSTSTCIHDHRRSGEPLNLWVGHWLHVLDGSGSCARVVAFDPLGGRLFIDQPAGRSLLVGTAYELRGGEEAPVVAIRYLMGIGGRDPIGPVEVRLGTTRGTNALLERKGAAVALVTTKGFGDILQIGYQDRPALFDLNVRKRDELAAVVVEVDERVDAAGAILHPLRENVVREQLEQTRRGGIEAVAVCLLHSYVNPKHEEIVAAIAESVGFAHVSVSSRVTRLEKLVPRADTTVVDAYLGPVIAGYVACLRRSLPEARLRLMTSSGGLTDAALATGKDTVLSGPAGGVMGCRHVARQAGFPKTIGFDMGGTSTDVCRVDEPPCDLEYQHETVKAGVRIMTPMLAVETVAAGGGSICGFDGQKLTVGPQSAGADPGPACYGRGGPLTITDMNLFLGRIVAGHFPFRLDGGIVQRKLAALGAEVNAATGSKLEPPELAAGFVAIANANMAAAIKRISLARGYDPREYTLTTFGGAGGQHACAIARTLQIPTILCSPLAGVLSAVGIGVADVKQIAQRSVNQLLDPAARPALEPVFDVLASDVRRALVDQGIDAQSLSHPVRTMDLCYAGQATSLTVPYEPFEDARRVFEAAHRRLYGYCHENRDIEIRVARSELAAHAGRWDTRFPVRAAHLNAAPRTTSMFVDGAFRSVPLHLRAELSSARPLVGPCIVIEDTSTIVVDPGWQGTVRETGDIVLSDVRSARLHETVSAEADPIQLELFNNQFAAIAEQMGTTLRRTALSVNVKERLDFSCAIFTPEGDLVVNAPHIPVHLGGMSDCIRALLQDAGALAPGDVYITNDPYRGGSHLNDVTVITPVHDDGGRRILFFVANRAHHAEIGGTRPGSMPPDSTVLAEEGVLIRAFRWIADGIPQHERLHALLAAPPFPSRAPGENLADIAAQAAANQTGVRELQAMIAKYGLNIVHGYMRHIQAAAERKVRAALRRLPRGVHHFEDRLDDGSPIRLTVTIAGDRAVLDFTGTGPVIRGNLNANRAIVTSAVLYCLRCLIDEDIPLNAGVLAPVNLILPECFLNPPASADPRQCPAVGAGNVETSQRIVDCIFGALGTVAASQGTMNNVLVGNQRFSFYETICGGCGAGPGFHGCDAVHSHMTNTRLTDPETLESRFPIRLIRFAIRRGSGGEGKYHGGCGVIRELEFLETCEVSIISQRRMTAPYGLHGGKCGQSGRNLLRRRGTSADETLEPVAHTSVGPGDRLTIETPGGGGWGQE